MADLHTNLKKKTKQTNVIKKENIMAIKWYVLPLPAHKITAYGQKNPAELSFEICYNQIENISSYLYLTNIKATIDLFHAWLQYLEFNVCDCQ